ncbi:hypothetical protein VTI74DRAFT_10070 [Chaetomium olivicolor]
MALFKALAAIGLKTTAFLQSLFLVPFNTFLQVVDRFPNFRRTTQPALPCSTSSGSTSSPQQSHNDNAGDGGRQRDSDMTTASSSTTPSGPQGQKPPTSKLSPTLARAPLAGKVNTSSPQVSTTESTQLSEGLSRLDLNENGTENGIGKQTTGVENDPTAIGSGAAEVTRVAPVPLTHAVSQTSRPKETASTIQLGSETVHIQTKVETPEQAAERAMHSRFMREALDMARLALRTNETPVGCVLVYKGRVIAKGMNATNVTRNGTRHAELMAISALLSFSPSSDLEASPEKGARKPLGDKTNAADPEETSTWGDVDPRDGHLFPYGQKLHPSPRVDPSVIHECTLYVTVEPCVMCASLLRQFGIKKVYFGAVNDKFGGTGGVFRIHKNSPHSMASAPPSPAPQNGKGLARPVLERRPASAADMTEEKNPMDEAQSDRIVAANPIDSIAPATSYDSVAPVTPIDTSSLPGDGGNIERGYEAEGGWGRDEAVTLLRQFYVQENNRAPVPRKKEGRAARLAAIMERDGHAGGPMSEAPKIENSGVNTPDAQEPMAENVVDATAA